MKRTTMMTRVAVTAFALSSAAFAESAAMRNGDNRQARQEMRIQKGVQSGQLTAKEASKLEQRQQKIEQAEDAARADGTVTAKERRKLHRMQDRAGKEISRKNHNRRTTPDAQ